MNWDALRVLFTITGILGALEVIALVVVVIICGKGSNSGRYGGPF